MTHPWIAWTTLVIHRKPFKTIIIEGTPFRGLLDSGADESIITK
jgi:hypothetical protein